MYTPKQVYTSFLGCIHPVSWGNLHGCTLMALLNWYQLVFKLSFSYFDKLFSGILLDFVCLYFSLFIIVTLAYYVDSFHLQKFMHFCVVYHLLWSYYFVLFCLWQAKSISISMKQLMKLLLEICKKYTSLFHVLKRLLNYQNGQVYFTFWCSCQLNMINW